MKKFLKKLLFLAIPVFAAILAAQQATYNEAYRPQFHFTPEINWTNDPNGLVYHDGEWHLFYQYNPFGDLWGHMSWGHAVSPDLLRWKHLEVALPEEDGFMIYSGSAVVDDDNTSGFGRNGKPPMVAVYTSRTETDQHQSIAYSIDRGRTWTKYSGNPVIDRRSRIPGPQSLLAQADEEVDHGRRSGQPTQGALLRLARSEELGALEQLRSGRCAPGFQLGMS